MLRQALGERIKPVITVNKLDRAFLELQLPSEDMYTAFVKHVENVNVLVATYNDDELGDVMVDPRPPPHSALPTRRAPPPPGAHC